MSHHNSYKTSRDSIDGNYSDLFKMQSRMIFVILVSVAYSIIGVEGLPPFSEDVLMFLPFLRHYEPPPPCPVNELYTTCTGKCADCEQRGKCTITTCISDCDCAPRFYRVTPGGLCEPVANCPRPECGENEVFRECGPICDRCTTYRCRVIQCDHKCYCKQGYLRNSDDVCIPEEECPKRKKCTNNEQWADVGPVNEFCEHSQNETLRNETQEVPQCYCKEGYKRNFLGNCIIEKLCPLIRCLGVEVYHDCIPKCNTTCRNYGNTDCEEDDNCYQGCFCPPGFVMNDFRACIPIDECSLDISQVKISEPSDIEEDEETSNQTDSATLSENTENGTIILDMDETTESAYNVSWTLETLDGAATESSKQDTNDESTVSSKDETSEASAESDAGGTSEVGRSQTPTQSEESETSEMEQSQASAESKAAAISEGGKSLAFAQSETSGNSGIGQSSSFSESKIGDTFGFSQSQAFSESKVSGTSTFGQSQAFAESKVNGTSTFGQSQAFAESKVNGTSKTGTSQAFAQAKSGNNEQEQDNL